MCYVSFRDGICPSQLVGRISFITQVSNDFISQLLAHAIESTGSKAAVYRGLPRQEVTRNTKDSTLVTFVKVEKVGDL